MHILLSSFSSLHRRRADLSLAVIFVTLLLSACLAAPTLLPPPPVTLINRDLPTATDTLLPGTGLETPPSSEGGSSYLPIDATQEIPLLAADRLPSTPTPVLIRPTATSTLTLSPTPRWQQFSDLLFIADQKLFRWDPITNYPGILAEQVEEFSVSASGQKIALLRRREVVANGEELFKLELLDFSTKQIVTLIEKTPRLYQMALSPDGLRIAYLLRDDGGVIYILRIAAPAEQLELGVCKRQAQTHCNRLAWSPDSRSILWSDARGLWVSYPDRAAAEPLHPNQVEVIDPKGQSTQINVTFDLQAWSPTGRFALVGVVPTPSGVRWLGVLDARAGRIEQVPDSVETPGLMVRASWMLDGSLLVAHSSDPATQSRPVVRLWSIVPTNSNLFVPLKSLELYAPDFPPLAAITTGTDHLRTDLAYCPDWLAQRDETTYNLGIRVPGANLAAVLYNLSLKDGSLITLRLIPYQATQVLWSPDGNGALILGQPGQVLFASTDGGEMLDLAALFGADAHGFTWLPPAPRK